MEKLEDAKVWLFSDVKEWSKVKRQAEREGKEVHAGSLHELIVE